MVEFFCINKAFRVLGYCFKVNPCYVGFSKDLHLKKEKKKKETNFRAN